MSPAIDKSSPISVHQFQYLLHDSSQPIFVLVIRFSSAVSQIWIGDQSGISANLAVGFSGERAGGPSTTKILGATGGVDDLSESFASKLSRRLKKPIFVGFNSSLQEPELVAEIQKKIFEEIKRSPELF